MTSSINLEIIVRINGLDTNYYEADLEKIVSDNIDAIMLPKARIEDLKKLDILLTEIEVKKNLKKKIKDLDTLQSEYDNLLNGIKKKNVEVMWQGSADHWKGKNPTLWPIVGNTYTKDYVIDGKTYAMKNHGLIRYATLNCVKNSQDEIVMELKSDENTLAQYPFEFTYQISYKFSNSSSKGN